MRQQLDIGLGFTREDDSLANNVLCQNFYPRFYREQNGKTNAALYATPGGVLAKNVNQTMVAREFRGWVHVPGTTSATDAIYFVVGNSVYKITDPSPLILLLGTINSAVTSPVSMATNGKVIIITQQQSGGDTHVIDLNSDNLTVLPDPSNTVISNFGVTLSVTLKDDRFVMNTSKEFFVGSPANVNNGLDFDALDFEDAETSGDPIIKVVTLSKELVVMGRFTSEVYQNVGGEDFPFRRIIGATVERGVLARESVQVLNNEIFFMGSGANEGLGVFAGSAQGVRRISNHAIDAVLQDERYLLSELAGAKAWLIQDEGGIFYGLAIGNITYVWDKVASDLSGMDIWHTRNHIEAKNMPVDKQILGDKVYSISQGDPSTSPQLMIERRSTKSDASFITPRLFTTKYLHNSERFSISWVEVVLSNAHPVTEEVALRLRLSLDNGETWRDMGWRVADISADGKFTRLQWRRLGRIPRDVLFEVSVEGRNRQPPLVDIARIDIDVSEIG